MTTDKMVVVVIAKDPAIEPGTSLAPESYALPNALCGPARDLVKYRQIHKHHKPMLRISFLILPAVKASIKINGHILSGEAALIYFYFTFFQMGVNS